MYTISYRVHVCISAINQSTTGSLSILLVYSRFLTWRSVAPSPSVFSFSFHCHITIICQNSIFFDLLQWLRGLGLLELHCCEPGRLVRQGVGSSPTPASMSSQVSACYEIKFSGRYRGFACVLFKLWQAITPGRRASGVWWEPPVWITDGGGQRTYRRPAHGTLPEKPAG